MRSMCRFALCFAVLALCLHAVLGLAQERKGARRLAPGVLTVVPIQPEDWETFTGPIPRKTLVGSSPGLNWKPNFLAKSSTLEEQAKRVILRRDIWYLEFAFKPLRMIEVDVPQPSGKMQRKQIWYMAYRVKNK